MAGCCADTLIGKTERKSESWRRAYRALNHGEARKACRRSSESRAFPQEARNFARLFADLQDERHEADYDPGWSCFKSDVEIRIRDARSAIKDFESLGVKLAVPLPPMCCSRSEADSATLSPSQSKQEDAE